MTVHYRYLVGTIWSFYHQILWFLYKWPLFCAAIFWTRAFRNDGTKSGIYSNTLKKMLPWYQTSFTKVYSEDISYPKNINMHSRINNINIHRNVNISSEIWLFQIGTEIRIKYFKTSAIYRVQQCNGLV